MSEVMIGKERILFVHNAYQQRGGEDSVVDAEMAMLRAHGHAVALFSRDNDAIGSMCKTALLSQTFWSHPAKADFTALAQSFRPDVVHVHNTFPLISPSVYWAASELRIPVVQTLHNFRLSCPQAMFLRAGRICEDCLGHTPWRGALRGCYRDSRVQSSVLAGMITLHRVLGTWNTKVTRYIALNEFCRKKFIEGGLPAARVAVKPNFVDFAAPSPRKRKGFLFVGRLSFEKGVRVLAEATAATPGATVQVIGTGPEEDQLDKVEAIIRLGMKTKEQVRNEMEIASALLVPSVWYETFGLVIVEAFASGTPVIASRQGVMPDLVQDGETGLLFNPGQPDDLAKKMRWAMDNPERMAEMGLAARARYEALYTAERNYEQLIAIYRDAIAEVKKDSAK